jgi:hypothetical protein
MPCRRCPSPACKQSLSRGRLQAQHPTRINRNIRHLYSGRQGRTSAYRGVQAVLPPAHQASALRPAHAHCISQSNEAHVSYGLQEQKTWAVHLPAHDTDMGTVSGESVRSRKPNARGATCARSLSCQAPGVDVWQLCDVCIQGAPRTGHKHPLASKILVLSNDWRHGADVCRRRVKKQAKQLLCTHNLFFWRRLFLR